MWYVLSLKQNLCKCTSFSSQGAAGSFSYLKIHGFPTFH
jgi:hypothetical protein